jgi:hypothetical protein
MAAESSHESYFDPIALLAEDAVSGLSHLSLLPAMANHHQQHMASCSAPHLLTVLCLHVQLVPCEFNHAIKSLGRLLDPTNSSSDVSGRQLAPQEPTVTSPS